LQTVRRCAQPIDAAIKEPVAAAIGFSA